MSNSDRSHERRASRPMVLIVDDTPLNIQLLAQTLDEDYELAIAVEGHMALKMAAESPPSLILLDITMPGMDGYEVCRLLKRNVVTATIPVIFLTARAETLDIVKGFEVGGVDYIVKPFNALELKARVRTHVQLHQLKSFLPICSYCSKIRDDDTWHEIADYINRKTGTNFSHGICPTCFPKVMKQIDES